MGLTDVIGYSHRLPPVSTPYWYWFPGVGGLMDLPRGLVVLIGPIFDFREGDLVAFPFSHASHLGGFPAFFRYSRRFLRVSYEICPYLSCISLMAPTTAFAALTCQSAPIHIPPRLSTSRSKTSLSPVRIYPFGPFTSIQYLQVLLVSTFLCLQSLIRQLVPFFFFPSFCLGGTYNRTCLEMSPYVYPSFVLKFSTRIL